MGSTLARVLLEDVASDWAEQHPSVPFNWSSDDLGRARIAAEPALRQALWSLLENAAEASPGDVNFEGSIHGDMLTFTVRDRGSGFSAEQLRRVGQLNQSTKGPGHGLGLFLAANVARQLGGRLDAANREGGGAEVSMSLPLIARGDAE